MITLKDVFRKYQKDKKVELTCYEVEYYHTNHKTNEKVLLIEKEDVIDLFACDNVVVKNIVSKTIKVDFDIDIKTIFNEINKGNTKTDIKDLSYDMSNSIVCENCGCVDNFIIVMEDGLIKIIECNNCTKSYKYDYPVSSGYARKLGEYN